MSMWDHIAGKQPPPGTDPGLTTAWAPPTEERTLTEVEKIQQATQQNVQMLNALIQQNAQTNAAIGQTNQTLLQLAASQRTPPPAAPEQPAGELWGSLTAGTQAQPKKAPQVSPEDIGRLVSEKVQEGFQRHQQTYTELQNQTQALDNHFRQNYPDLVPHYDLIKERFGVEAKSTDLQTAYANTINWAKSVLPRLAPPTQRQPPAPNGGGGASDGEWVPNTTPANGREVVVDKAGQKYAIERYYDGVPMVSYGKDKEQVHLDRWTDFRNDHILVRQGEMAPAEFKDKWPEFQYLAA